METGGSDDSDEDRTVRAVTDLGAGEHRAVEPVSPGEASEDDTVAVGSDETIPVAGPADAVEIGGEYRSSGRLRTTGDGSYSRSAVLNATGEGLDPERRVVSAPAGPDGEAAPTPAPMPGLSHRLPVVYGARAVVARSVGEGSEMGALGGGRRFGLDPMPDAPGEVDAGSAGIDRSRLPSLARRERRARALTRTGYLCLCVAAVLGLVVVALLALD